MMDATERWETEALRTSPHGRPRPSRSRRSQASTRNWVTLKEAEHATGIPTNTLRKWVRKAAIPSYLESEGEFVLRMVDLDAVEARARKLGRRVEPTAAVRDGAPLAGPSTGSGETRTSEVSAPERPDDTHHAHELVVDLDELPSQVEAPTVPDSQFPEDTAPHDVPPDTMLVPVDAWNKMLAQLGNLHEAGQQLADARERAAKAETEAAFLRERLAEFRRDRSGDEPGGPSVPDDEELTAPNERSEGTEGSDHPETTTYWRYLTTGWRERRRRIGS